MPTEKTPVPDEPLLPELGEADWDGLDDGADEIAPDEADIITEEELTGVEEEEEESLEEDDDNPYQNSDEALPDDDEEKAIDHLLRRDGEGRFGD